MRSATLFSRRLLILLSVAAFAAEAAAKGPGTSTGLTLLKNSGARSSAMGDAFVTMTNDVTAMEFNPASLASLQTGQMSLHHERGFFDDTFSKVVVGTGLRSGRVFGLSVGYFDSGKQVLFDGVNPQRSVVAQKDLLANFGAGFQRRSASLGVGVRYLRSELAETASGAAMAADLGFQYQLTPRLRFGASGPVYQSKLRYESEDEDLPRIYRGGIGWDFAMALATGDLPVRVHFDVPYDAGEGAATFSIGAETYLGIMALRLGSNSRSDVQSFSIGAGFALGRANLDYAFGMANNKNFEAVHKINLSFRFDDLRTRRLSRAPSYRVYEVKPGETLQSIAQRRYGSTSDWQKIYSANRHVYPSPEDILPGSSILLPD